MESRTCFGASTIACPALGLTGGHRSLAILDDNYLLDCIQSSVVLFRTHQSLPFQEQTGCVFFGGTLMFGSIKVNMGRNLFLSLQGKLSSECNLPFPSLKIHLPMTVERFFLLLQDLPTVL